MGRPAVTHVFLSGNKITAAASPPSTHWQTHQHRFLLSHCCYFLLLCIFLLSTHCFLCLLCFSCRKTLKQGTRAQQEVLVTGQGWWEVRADSTTGDKSSEILHPLYQPLSLHCYCSCGTTAVRRGVYGGELDPAWSPVLQWKLLTRVWEKSLCFQIPVSTDPRAQTQTL